MKHHYIPKFYLKPWVGGDHKLEEYHRGYVGQILSRRQGRGGTGKAKNLYRLPGVSRDSQHKIETAFMGIVDADAALVRDAMLDDNIPSDSRLRYAWTRFMLSLLLRNPDEVALFKRRFSFDWNKPDPQIQHRWEAVRRPDDPLRFEDKINQMDPTMNEREALLTLTRLIQQDNVSRSINMMKWRVFDTSRVIRKLVTSDRPLMVSDGIVHANGHLALPISPTRLFVAASMDAYLNELGRMPIGKLVRMVNDASIQQARDYVYGVDDSQLGEVRRKMSKGTPPSLIRRITGD